MNETSNEDSIKELKKHLEPPNSEKTIKTDKKRSESHRKSESKKDYKDKIKKQKKKKKKSKKEHKKRSASISSRETKKKIKESKVWDSINIPEFLKEKYERIARSALRDREQQLLKQVQQKMSTVKTQEAALSEQVQRQQMLSEAEWQLKLDRIQQELQQQKELNEELQFQVTDLQTTLDAKKQVEYYSNIIGMALPGLAKFFTNSPVGTAMSFLAGTEEKDKEKKELNSTEKDETKEQQNDQRQSIINLINDFSTTLSNQELGTLYLLFIELEKDKENIQRILKFITQVSTQKATETNAEQ